MSNVSLTGQLNAIRVEFVRMCSKTVTLARVTWTHLTARVNATGLRLIGVTATFFVLIPLRHLVFKAYNCYVFRLVLNTENLTLARIYLMACRIFYPPMSRPTEYMDLAMSQKRLAVLEHLIYGRFHERSWSNEEGPIHRAVKNNDLPVLGVLLRGIPYSTYRDPGPYCYRYDEPPSLLEIAIRQFGASTSTTFAAIKDLLVWGAPINGDTTAASTKVKPPLYLAIKFCRGDQREQLVRFLLEQGANPNRGPCYTLNPRSEILGQAILAGDLRIVRLLLGRGADPSHDLGFDPEFSSLISAFDVVDRRGTPEIQQLFRERFPQRYARSAPPPPRSAPPPPPSASYFASPYDRALNAAIEFLRGVRFKAKEKEEIRERILRKPSATELLLGDDKNAEWRTKSEAEVLRIAKTAYRRHSLVFHENRRPAINNARTSQESAVASAEEASRKAEETAKEAYHCIFSLLTDAIRNLIPKGGDDFEEEEKTRR